MDVLVSGGGGPDGVGGSDVLMVKVPEEPPEAASIRGISGNKRTGVLELLVEVACSSLVAYVILIVF